MKMRSLALVLVILAILIAGCGKGKKEEKTTEQTTTTTTTSTDTTGPKIEAGKLSKTIDALSEVGDQLVELNKNPNKPQNQQEAVTQMMTTMDKVAKKNGLTDGKELISYVDFIVQISSMQSTVENLDSVLEQLPPDQRNSPDVQKSIENLKTKYEDAKKQYGKEVFTIISNNKVKIKAFFDKLQSMRAQPGQAQAQQPKKFQQVKTKPSQKPTGQNTPEPKVKTKK
ncbi:hypothetical protein J7L68_00945 [bacterium]|nr:hypothetical protein [bacterium]